MASSSNQQSSPKMTANDRAVLNTLLNPLYPELGLASGIPLVEDTDDSSTPKTEDNSEQFQTQREVSEAESKAIALEVEGVRLAEAGDLPTALQRFTAAVDVCPRRASCYNNRAQALRLSGDVNGDRRTETGLAAMLDLNTAVGLIDTDGNSDRKTACQVLVQRAMLFRLNGHDDDAKADYKRAATLGSAFARTQLVAMNPYAAMCNKMLHEMMGKLQRGEPEDSPPKRDKEEG